MCPVCPVMLALNNVYRLKVGCSEIHMYDELCFSCCRYTYGQPVRGTADVAVSIQPYSEYDTGRYGSKLVNVQVSMSDSYFCNVVTCQLQPVAGRIA